MHRQKVWGTIVCTQEGEESNTVEGLQVDRGPQPLPWLYPGEEVAAAVAARATRMSRQLEGGLPGIAGSHKEGCCWEQAYSSRSKAFNDTAREMGLAQSIIIKGNHHHWSQALSGTLYCTMSSCFYNTG